MSIETLAAQPLKKEVSKKRVVKGLMAILLGSSVLAGCSSSKPSSEASTSNPAAAPSSQPKKEKPNSSPASSAPNSSSPNSNSSSNSTQNSSVGTPIANLCDVPQLEQYISKTFFNPTYGSVRCKNTSSILPPNAPGVGNWGQGAIGSGNGSIVIGITLNDDSQSSTFFPADHNVWATDLKKVSSIPGAQIIPNAINGQEIIWINDSNSSSSGSIVDEVLATKYGNYVLEVADEVTSTAQSQNECIAMAQLTETYGFSS